MQIANARLRLNKVGSDVPITGVTPAEALVLHVLHQANNGGSTFGEDFDKIDIQGEALVESQIPDMVQPAIPAISYQPAKPATAPVQGRPYIPGKPAVIGVLAQGTPGQPGYVAGVEGQPEVLGVAAIPYTPAQDAVPEIKARAYQPERVLTYKTGTRPRTDVEEIRRLTAKYGNCVNKRGDKIVKLIWPEMSPKLPQKFSELDWKGIQYDGTEVAAINYLTGAPVATK
jgi:hypothetical protein